MLRQNFRNQNASRRGFNQTVLALTVIVNIFHPAFDFGVQIDNLFVQRQLNFVEVRKDHTFAVHTFGIIGQIINTQNHILCRHDNRFTRCRRQNIVGRHHQNAGFQLCLNRQRNMNGHLVTVEVRVECGTNQRMQMNGFALNQHRLKRLNTQTVQSRRTVQKYWVFADNFFQNIPDFRPLFFHHSLGRFNRRGMTVKLQFGIDKRLKQLQSHFLRQTALMQFQFRTDGNNRTSRIVNTFTQKVLTETSLFTFQHIRQ